jgi:hypothetical protein
MSLVQDKITGPRWPHVNAGQEPPLFDGEVAVSMHG